MVYNQNFLRKSQHQVRLMKKWKKKKKVKDLVRLLVGFTDKKMEAYVRSQFQNQVQLMKKRKKKIKVMDFTDKRMPAYDVYVQDLSKDTEFLLFECYRLRNVHVIKDITVQEILQQEFSVIFTFEDMKFVAYVCYMGNWKCEMDFGLLQLDLGKQCAKILPSAILSKNGPPSKMGGIHIICHPDGGGVDTSSIFEERKCLVIYPNDLQLMTQELRYIPCSFNRSLGCIIFEEICQFVNRELPSAGTLYCESHGKIRRMTEYNGSTYSLLESLFNERIEMKRESKYTVSIIEERWFLFGASVCCICVNGLPEGTGFLLFDRYILTNAHVIKGIINEGILKREVSIMFTFDDMKGGTYFLPLNVKPEVVVGWFDGNWQSGMDFVLLELDLQEHEAQILPPALLSTYGPPSGMGDIYIIGYPGGGGKTSELCPITEDPICLEGRIFRYKTNFTEGSSGSPIFGENLQLLGMHTGGDKVNGSAIGFGISMKIILEKLLLQMIQQNKHEPLLKFIAEAMKSEHTFGNDNNGMLGRQDVDGVLSTVITTSKTCYEFQELDTRPCSTGQTDPKKLTILQDDLIEDDTMMEVD